ncbi:MAG TPA: type VI secretion system tip protein VgrG [Puia sp.]|nr:type VI secretion system tip protein VgrG [Puia sp.]
MPQTTSASVPALSGVSSYDISVDGTALDNSLQVISISISKELNKISVAKMIIRDGNAAEKDFEISNGNLFIPGKKILIKIGTDGKNVQAFKGIIIKHAIKIKENGSSELHIECRDASVKMSIGRHNRYFENLKDSELFDDLIGYYQSDISSDVQETTLTHKQIVQHHISDWDFMLLRAEANGMLVNTDDGKIVIAKPDTSANPALTLEFGSTVLEFEAEMDSRNQWKNVVAQSWNYSDQDLYKANTSSAKFTEFGNINGSDLADKINTFDYELHHSGFLLEQELQDWVDGAMLRSRLAKIRGRAKFTGSTDYKPGIMVKLAGVGNRFNGNAYVTAVKHEVGNGKWETHVQFGLDPQQYAIRHNDDINDMPSAGLVSAIHGLQIGKVVQLQDDPDGENRILIKTPTIDNSSRGIWTRVASLDAGDDRGAFFMPEIDDEVIIGFINDDPRHAVMLGMLHSSAKAAPITAQDANNEKGFTTRSKMHVSFNDDTKTITIDTPAGNSITLDESGTKIEIKDQSSNKITMDTSGIKLESPMNIEVKAGVDLTLSAGASLSIGGVSLSVKADADVSIEGAISKLSAQGITEITGSIVKIN